TPSRISAPTATLNQRIQRHEVASVKKPPSAGAIPPNTALAPPHTPTARPRRSPRNVSVTIASDPGVSTAPPTPTTTRLTISTVALPARAAGTEAPIYTSVPIVSSRTRPNTSASRPAAIISAEYASRYPVTVHSSSVSEASN